MKRNCETIKSSSFLQLQLIIPTSKTRQAQWLVANLYKYDRNVNLETKETVKNINITRNGDQEKRG